MKNVILAKTQKVLEQELVNVVVENSKLSKVLNLEEGAYQKKT